MANEEHLKKLKEGVETWNAWRKENPGGVDLSGADLRDVNRSGAHLRGANLSRANLRRAHLSLADLSDADLRGAYLRGAVLSRANLRRAHLSRANLMDADLSGADLSAADLSGADLKRTYVSRANLDDAVLGETVFADVNLSEVKLLDSCRHLAPSVIDHRTLASSGELPLSFLRGCGLPDSLIDYLPSILGRAIEYYSCFISYSSADEDFAKRLHADLQETGVRCWFAPEDMKIGDKILDSLDRAIRLRDKILLVVSKDAITSEWVEDEVTTGFEEERERKTTVLFPVRVDGAVMESEEPWAAKLRARHIGDFREWKDHDSYKKSFERLLRDLQKEPAEPANSESDG